MKPAPSHFIGRHAMRGLLTATLLGLAVVLYPPDPSADRSNINRDVLAMPGSAPQARPDALLLIGAGLWSASLLLRRLR